MEGGVLTRKEKKEIAKEEKRRERKRGEVFLLVKKLLLLVLFGGVFVFFGVRIVGWFTAPGVESREEVPEVEDSDWVKGNREAGVTLIEYSDFECPACADYSEQINRLSEEFQEDLRVVYRHFPLVSIHKSALPAAYASEAAGVQGKFWEMHHKLFEKQSEWLKDKTPEDKFVGYAKEIGIDEDKFVEDMKGGEIGKKVKVQLESAGKLKLTYTPTLFLNGKLVQPESYEELRELVRSEL